MSLPSFSWKRYCQWHIESFLSQVWPNFDVTDMYIPYSCSLWWRVRVSSISWIRCSNCLVRPPKKNGRDIQRCHTAKASISGNNRKFASIRLVSLLKGWLLYRSCYLSKYPPALTYICSIKRLREKFAVDASDSGSLYFPISSYLSRAHTQWALNE